MNRLAIVQALDELITREDGLSFQRLARRLLKTEFPDLVAHAEKADRGRDASFTRGSQRGVLLASLTATWDKLNRDLARARTAGPDFQLAIFCTPRTVTNDRITRWREQAIAEGIELEVRERAWVTDECLRVRNAIIAIDELRITPAQAQSGNPEVLLASEPFVVSPERVLVGRTSVSMHRNRGIVTWSEAPLHRNSERVVLAVCETDKIERAILGVGADAQCASLDNDLYVCWTRRAESTPLHALSVWRESTQRVVEVAAVEELIAPPHLILWDGEPAVVYLAGGRVKPLVISVLAIASGAANHLEIAAPDALSLEAAAIDDLIDNRRVDAPAISVRVGGLSVAHERGRAIALVYGAFSGHLFALTDRWHAVEALWPFGGEIYTAEVALMGGLAHCLTKRGSGIYSGVADLSGREWSTPLLVAAHGWHPHCARAPGGRLGAWAGGPPLPLGAQNETFATGGTQQWIEVAREVAHEALDRDMHVRGTPNPGLAAMEETPFASPMAPLWLGIFDEQARCVGESDSLGFFGHAARWPQVFVNSDGRGLLLWECGDEDQVLLLARWLQV
jgi:hypothetical protein